MASISVKNLSKVFTVPKKQPGFIASVKSIFHREYIQKQAINDISFTLEQGELVGFIGENGAGKTTTLKCLSGLLYPSGGTVSVLGYTPFDRKKAFLKQLALVMGQKNQLWWDLPAMESFQMNQAIYNIDKKQFNKTVEELVELLEIKDSVLVPVRNLSLGQRMKCELVGALLHRPKVLFLDEPTIGLDVIMQKKLREFIRHYNQEHNATIILTSHYMEDVKELCKRVLIIHNGTLAFDGKLEEIIHKYATHKRIVVTFGKKVLRKDLEKFGEIVDFVDGKADIQVPVSKSNDVASQLFQSFPVDDLLIEEMKIEEIIREVFSSSK